MEKMYKTKQQHSGSTFNSVYEGANSKTNRSLHRFHKAFFGKMMEVHEETMHEKVLVTTRRSFGRKGVVL